jgi:hypothetical protein
MKGRIATIVATVVVTAFALSIGIANAGGDSESCLSKTMNVTNTNGDGTKCETIVSGTGPNKATAKASGLSVAVGEAVNGATVSANAKQNSHAAAIVHAGLGSATSSGVGANAVVDISPTGGGKAKATGPNSNAVSEITSTNPAPAGGNVQSTASGDSSNAVAEVDSTDVGEATANAKGSGSNAVATVTLAGGGKAKATSNGSMANAVSSVEEACQAETNAKGANSSAVAQCIHSGSVVTAEATKGSIAVGSDINPPTCTPKNGGIAKVRSPMGNCP